MQKNNFLDNLDFEGKSGLIIRNLKNPSLNELNEENLRSLKNELPLAFLQYKLKNDPQFQINLDTNGFSDNGIDQTENIDLAEKTNADLSPKSTQNNEGDLSPDSDSSIPNFEGDPFTNLDERLNIKENLAFFNEEEKRKDKAAESEVNLDRFSDIDELLKNSNTDLESIKESDPTANQEFFDIETDDNTDQESKDFSPNLANNQSMVGQEVNDKQSEFSQDPSPTIGINDSEKQSDELNITEEENFANFEEEEKLYYDYQQSLDKSIDHKFDLSRIQEIIKRFNRQNQKKILTELKGNNLSDDNKKTLSEEIIAGKSEDFIIEQINQILLQKAGYEIIERREKKIANESAVFNKAYQRYRTSRLFSLTTIFLLFFLLTGYLIFFSYKNLYPYRLYQKAISAVNNEQFQEAENLFIEAYKLNPHIDHTSKLSIAYLKKNKFLEGEKKIDLIIADFPNQIESLAAEVQFYRLAKKHNKSRELINQAKSLFPNDIFLKKEELELLISEGKAATNSTVARQLWLEAEKITSKLIQQDPDNIDQYVQKKIQLTSLSQEYQKSKNYFIFFETLNHPMEIEPISQFLELLLDINEKNRKLPNLSSVKKDGENDIVSTIDLINRILSELKNQYGEHYIIARHQARWLFLANESAQAKLLAQKSVDLLLKENNYLLNDELVKSYNLLGYINLHDKEAIPALKAFNESLNIDPQNYLANYYSAKISMLKLNQSQLAYEHFQTAKEGWRDQEDIRYADILYSMGYLNFINGKNTTNTDIQADYFKQSIYYWSKLAKKQLATKDYLIHFNLATGYLYLKEYDLAEIFYKNNLEELQAFVKFYKEKSDYLIQTSYKKDEFIILSDTYNNLAVTLINKNNLTYGKPRDITGQASEYLITSIILKDKIGELKGIPYVNFNTLNDYPKNSLAFLNRRPFLISDTNIPRSLLPEIF